MLEQKRPADLAITDQAWIRRLAARVPIQEVLYDSLPENILGVNDIKGDIEPGGHAACLGHRVRRAAAVGILFARLAPQAQHHANDFIALLLEQGGGN